MSDVLVLAAHPDDELLGVGGTIRRHVDAGDTVHVHIACCHGLRDQAQRLADAALVAERLGTRLTTGWLPQLSTTVREARPVVEQLVAEIGPAIVYTHHPGDLNADHRALSEAVTVACRPYAAHVESLRWFETPSSTEWGAALPAFTPTLFVKIDPAAKAVLAELYGSEMRDLPHPRNPVSLLHRAYYWGSVAGFAAAEPFQVVRSLW